jgi:hypothetical protein
MPQKTLNSIHYALEGATQMRLFLLMYTKGANVALSHSKLLEFAFLFVILKMFFCLLLAFHINVVPPLDVHQPQKAYAKMLTTERRGRVVSTSASY